METTYKIAIPSRGRVKEINKHTLNIIPKELHSRVYVFVNPAEELEEYKKHGLQGVNYIPVPFTGNISKVRNFCLDYFEGKKNKIVSSL